jgi:WD40 repeat protein
VDRNLLWPYSHTWPLYAAFVPDGVEFSLLPSDTCDLGQWRVGAEQPEPFGVWISKRCGGRRILFSTPGTLLAFSHNGAVAAMGSSSVGLRAIVEVWRTRDGDRVLVVPHAPEAFPRALSLSPDGQILAIGAGDGSVQLWSVADQTQLAVIGGRPTGSADDQDYGVRSIAFSPDGRLLAVAAAHHHLRVWGVGR